MEMSPQAKKLWEKIPTKIRVKLLNNVWCGRCLGMCSVGNAKAIVKDGDIIIEGTCTKCGNNVARLIEGSQVAGQIQMRLPDTPCNGRDESRRLEGRENHATLYSYGRD